MNQLKRSKKLLVVLFLVFIAPGVFAILFYMHPNWLQGLPTNKGVFVRPPIQLSVLQATEKNKWHLVVWCPQGCGEGCLNDVDKMARVRLALGRRLYQVDLWMLQKDTSAMCASETLKTLQSGAIQLEKIELAIQSEQAKNILFSNEPKVFLADPNNYVVLLYSSVASSKNLSNHVFQDLKRLLNTKEQA